jgi:hypothetical protein
MPNWCLNNATITHDDPAKLTELVDAYKRGELMEHYMPTPRDPDDPTKLLGEGKPVTPVWLLPESVSDNWWGWRVSHWGTKWDVGGEDAFCERMVTADNTVVLSFDSAWSPPIAFYSFMKSEHGFDIRASYWEPGMAFCGDWIDGMDNFYEGEWRDFPDHLVEEYNMKEFYEEDEEVSP